MSRRHLTVAGFVSSLVVLATASYAFQLPTGRGAGLGETVVLSRSPATVLVLIPSGGINHRELKIDLAADRGFAMRELDRATVAAAWRCRSVTVAAGMAQLGFTGLYTERTCRFGAAWHTGPVAVGGTCSALSVSFGGRYPGLSATTLGVDLSYRSSRVLGALSIDNLTSPRLEENSPAFEPTYSALVEIIGLGSFSLTGRATLERYQKPQFAVGQIVDVSRHGALFWGMSSAPLEYGGGVEVAVERSRIAYAASYHPTLGLSHSVTLSVAFTVPRAQMEAAP
ncbi:MAG: hypothetical protein AB1744_05670 [Candidatus Zixiibacteriota bacterium]